MEASKLWQEETGQESGSISWLSPIKADLCERQAAPAMGGIDTPFPADEWTEEEVVLLHWHLLSRIRLLPDARAPLEEKIEILRWLFTDAKHDQEPFSFVSCVRVIGVSPLSPAPCFIGAADAEEVRDWIRCRLKRWLVDSLACYPAWVRDAIIGQPGWIAQQLESNPQWLNQQLRRNRVEGDLFA